MTVPLEKSWNFCDFLKDPGKMARPQVLDFLLDVSKELKSHFKCNGKIHETSRINLEKSFNVIIPEKWEPCKLTDPVIETEIDA